MIAKNIGMQPKEGCWQSGGDNAVHEFLEDFFFLWTAYQKKDGIRLQDVCHAQCKTKSSRHGSLNCHRMLL